MMKNPEYFINFSGQDWNLVQNYLEDLKKKKVDFLVGDLSHDQSNQIRGAIQVINQLLALPKAADNAAKRENK